MMNLPTHPSHTDDEQANAHPRRRVIIIVAISVVVLLASIHLLRAALG